MRKILTQKEPPFIFMILLAAFSWTTSHVVSRTIEKPVIEFQSSISNTIPIDIIDCDNNAIDKDKSLELHKYLLTNISKDHLFKNLSFLIRSNDGKKIHGVRLRPRSPAVSGNKAETCSTEYGLFADVTLHPGWQFELDIVADKNSITALHLNSASEAINLKESDLETWIVRNETQVLVGFLIVISILAFTYMIYIAQARTGR